jgi:hypothetical protein
VLLRVLGADLHGFRVLERGCGVNVLTPGFWLRLRR